MLKYSYSFYMIFNNQINNPTTTKESITTA